MAKGRKSVVHLADQKQVFIKYAQILQNPNIKSNDPIFLTISKELDFKMSPLALFLSLKRNNFYFFDVELPGQQTTGEGLSTKSTSSSLTNISSIDYDELSQKQNETKTFSYEIDLYDWKKIKPIYTYQKRTGTSTYKKYMTMPKYKWSNLLKMKIYEHSKLPCTWTLKREKVSKSKIFVKGNCSQCTACIRMESSKSTDKIHTVYCKITNIDRTVKHNPKKKSKLTPYYRQQLAKVLKYKPAIVVHNELASDILVNKKDESKVTTTPTLPSVSALRQIKSEVRRGQWLHPNPIMSLVIMAKSTHKNVIRSLSVHPNFFIYYWNEEQINYYNKYLHKLERITITIDATGSFFETMRLSDGTQITKRLFLYAGLITANPKFKSVPVLQMVTDAHGKESILHWINQWKTLVGRSPHEIISDDSSALIAANTEAFTEFNSTKDYLTNMFAILEGQSSEIPPTFIRLDTSHFIKTVHNLKCFNDVDSHIKYFYIRCILYLKKCEDFQTAKEVIFDMIQVCLCQYDDDDTAGSVCETALNRLTMRVKNIDSHHTAEISSMDNEKFIDVMFEEHHSKDINFFIWLDEIIAQCYKQSVEIKGKNKNSYFFPTFVSEFRRILAKLPLWSNLLCPVFKSDNTDPSSSGVESYFKTLKHLLFQTKFKKYRIDEFINLHSNYLNSEIALATNDLDNDIQNKDAQRCRKRKLPLTKPQTKSKKRKQSKPLKSKKNIPSFATESIFSDRPSFIENWKGEADANATPPKIKIKFVKNGNLCDSVPIGKNSIQVDLRNTCSFDSVLYLLSAAYSQNMSFQERLNNYPDELIPQYIKLLSDPFSNDVDIHKIRSEIGVLYFDTKEKTYCDFACNVSFIYERVALKYCYSAIFTKKCINDSCLMTPISRLVGFLPLNFNIISVFGIKGLEDAICIAEDKNTCKSCNNQTTVCKYTLSNTVSFDLNGCKKIILKEIPESIMILGSSYTLMGAIEFIPGVSITDMGHYKCHILAKDEMLCYDDYESRIRKSTEDPIVIHSLTYIL